jgi:3-methylcrotonyl-CoA carboxylase alpha subunit
MGIRSIAVFSEADAGAFHTRACDEAVGIGGVTPRESYLRGDLIIGAARRSRAQAIHPGYGFLSENAEFAQACADAGIVFIGPPPSAMRAVGDKIAAKETAIAAGVPVLPGYLGRTQARDVLAEEAKKIGIPLLIKAAAGGGGRGMRLVSDFNEFHAALDSAQREAQAAFGDPTIFLERYVQRPRHIEVQILADLQGNCIALGERECSIQRRYQKILEESPSPAVDSGLRAALEDAALKIASAVRYVNAGTVEFMLDEFRRFYFLEMNARLQVEHPVSELVTGIDLVRKQIEIAAGANIELAPKAPASSGHAIEVRIYAEDPVHDFLPSTGRITSFVVPKQANVRNDVAVEEGSLVPAAYDPMLAKLIVHDATRATAISRLRGALDDYVVGGVTTNIPLLRWLVEHPAFKSGDTSTDFLTQHFQAEFLEPVDSTLAECAAAGALQALRSASDVLDPWQRLGAWRHSSSPRRMRFSSNQVEADWLCSENGWYCQTGERGVLVHDAGQSTFTVRSDGRARKFAAWLTADGVSVSLQGTVARFALPKPPSASAENSHQHGAEAATGSVQAPMSGTIVKVNVRANDPVKAFEVLLVMEAMKMEHSIVAPYPGIVTAVQARAGQSVTAGDTLAEISEA